MGAIGHTGTFLTDQPVSQNYLGNAMQTVEDNAFRRRQEDVAKKAEKDKQDEADKADLAKINPTLTGGSRDGVVINAGHQYLEAIGNKKREYESGKISKSDYDIYKQNAISDFSTLNQGQKLLNDQVADFSKLAAEGKIYNGAVDQAMRVGGALDKGDVHTEIDSNGRIQMMTFERDEKGQPKAVLNKSSLADFTSSNFTPTMNFEFDKDIAEYRTAHPLDLTETMGDMSITGVKKLSQDRQADISKRVDALMADRDKLAIAYHQMNPSQNFSKNVPESEVAKTKSWLVERYKDAFQTEITKQEALGRANHALAKKKDDKENEKEIPVVTSVDKTSFIEDVYKLPTTVEKGKGKDGKDLVTSPKIKVATKDILKNGVSFRKGIKIDNVGGENSDIDNLTIKSVYIDKDNRVVYNGTVLLSKGGSARSGETKDGGTADSTTYGASYGRVSRKASAETEGIIAEAMGYASAEELKDYLRDLNKNESSSGPSSDSKSKAAELIAKYKTKK